MFKNFIFDYKYNTRDFNFMLPKHHLTLSEKGPLYAAMKFFNLLPSEIKRLLDQNSFKGAVKQYLIDIEPYSLSEYYAYKGRRL